MAEGRVMLFARRLRRVRQAGLGAGIILVVVLLAVLADLISPYNPEKPDLGNVLEAPTLAHLFGTDELGRDILSRVVFSARTSLLVSLGSVVLATGLGTFLGLVSGYWRGWLDSVIMRVMDALLTFPLLALALAIAAALGPSATNAAVAIGVTYTPYFARLTRGQTLSVREHEYVQAARACGASGARIVHRHILPNVAGPIIVQATLNMAFAITVEASLSFLGLGIRPPTPSWGSMLQAGYPYMERAPWLATFPGLAIMATVLGWNFLGDGLRDALDPRMRARSE